MKTNHANDCLKPEDVQHLQCPQQHQVKILRSDEIYRQYMRIVHASNVPEGKDDDSGNSESDCKHSKHGIADILILQKKI